MIKKCVFIVIIIVGLFGNLASRDFSLKCHPTLAYWYNQFYDPDTSKSDSTIIQNIQYPILYRGDTPCIYAVLDYSGDFSDLLSLGIKIMDTVSNGLSVTFPLSNLPQIDAIPAIQRIFCTSANYARPIDPIKPYKLRNCPDTINVKAFIEMNMPRYCIDTTGIVPTIDAMIFTNGNYRQLDSLGIDTCSKLGTTVVAKIPIALIRSISSLESVEKLIFSSRGKTN